MLRVPYRKVKDTQWKCSHTLIIFLKYRYLFHYTDLHSKQILDYEVWLAMNREVADLRRTATCSINVYLSSIIVLQYFMHCM